MDCCCCMPGCCCIVLGKTLSSLQQLLQGVAIHGIVLQLRAECLTQGGGAALLISMGEFDRSVSKPGVVKISSWALVLPTAYLKENVQPFRTVHMLQHFAAVAQNVPPVACSTTTKWDIFKWMGPCHNYTEITYKAYIFHAAVSGLKQAMRRRLLAICPPLTDRCPQGQPELCEWALNVGQLPIPFVSSWIAHNTHLCEKIEREN